MFDKLNIRGILMLLIFLPAFLIQSWKVPLVYVWYYANKDVITDRFCINKARPELMCAGKCYIDKVIKAYESSEEDWKSIASKSIDERRLTLIKDDYSVEKSSLDEIYKVKLSTLFLFNYSHSIEMMVFRPPRVLS